MEPDQTATSSADEAPDNAQRDGIGSMVRCAIAAAASFGRDVVKGFENAVDRWGW